MKNLLLIIGFLGMAGLGRPAFAQLAYSEPQWYLPTGDENCELFIQEYGRGKETVIALHGGWGNEHSSLLEAFKGLEERYHLVFYDQRGSLRSHCPSSLISVDKHVADLETLRKALGLKRLNLVAHSMGTFLAMDYLQHYPDHVQGLVLLGAMPPRTQKLDALWAAQEETAKSFIRRPETTAELRKQGLDKDPKTLSPKDATYYWRIRFSAVNLYRVERWRQMDDGRAFYRGEASQAAVKTMPPGYDFTPALMAHPCPIWFIVGDHDYTDPGHEIIKLATENPSKIHLEVIKEAGHVTWIDAPQGFATFLLRAITSSTQCQGKDTK
jgi:proline-specific peptidase